MPPAIASTFPFAFSTELIAELASRTGAEVRFDEGSRAIYASDLSHYRQVPIGVVVPRTIDDVVATVAVCREQAIPILARGAGTSLAGQTCNVAVVLRLFQVPAQARRAEPRGPLRLGAARPNQRSLSAMRPRNTA